MKTLRILSILAIFALASCTKAVEELLPTMTATVDGTAWASSVRATVFEQDKFVITGTSISGSSIVITILGSATGVYEQDTTIINPKVECFAAYKESTASTTDDSYLSYKGTVDLTEVNTSSEKISGTFNFTILKNKEPMEITNGEFSRLKYQKK